MSYRRTRHPQQMNKTFSADEQMSIAQSYTTITINPIMNGESYGDSTVLDCPQKKFYILRHSVLELRFKIWVMSYRRTRHPQQMNKTFSADEQMSIAQSYTTITINLIMNGESYGDSTVLDCPQKKIYIQSFVRMLRSQ